MILPPHFVLLEDDFRVLFTHVGGRSGTFGCCVGASAPMAVAEEQTMEAISLVKNGYGMQLLYSYFYRAVSPLCTVELYIFPLEFLVEW